MKIILISRIAKLGNVGDVVSVKDGYAKNFLIPQKKAIFYNAANYKIFESKKQQFEVENQKNSSSAESNKDKLAGKDIVIFGNASDDGRLYGSVTTATIASKVNEILGSKKVSRIDIILKKPIKDIGVYDVKVDLYSGITANIRVIVSRSESEIETLLAAHTASEKKTQNKSKAENPAEEVAVEQAA
ncbi:MAG: ribosomal protein [Rickettsiaceae bacterium]|jgi:large subunit ribosomal protein L9|nr:ribosomal protein [Rickettsiaceae bacterium]